MSDVTALDTRSSQGQRRQVTVLFADMAGFTKLAETLGEEQTYHLMQQVHQQLNEAVHAHSGTVQEMTGDGIMALFGAPIAIENAPLQACRAALDIHARIGELGEETHASHKVRPVFRVGIHSGSLVVGSVGDDKKSGVTALGDTVNLASRMEAQAEPGQTCLSEATHALVEGFAECAPLGEREIKGKTAPQKLWSLLSVRENVTSFDIARDKGLTQFVGRSGELSKLQKIWERVCQDKTGAVLITGEAGIGKSRLVHEFQQGLGGERALVLEGHCDIANLGKPFGPLIQVIRDAFRISDNASPEQALEKMRRGLEILGQKPDETLPYLAHLLGLPGEEAALADVAHETLGIRIRDTILAILQERCRVDPTIVFLDGLHSADSATEGLIQRVLERLENIPLLIIATARPGYAAGWTSSDLVQPLPLTALPERDIVDLTVAKLGSEEVSDKLTALIASKSQGNPLFAEEIVEHLQKTGLDAGSPDAVSENFTLPSTVENLLMDQFDQLDGGPRAVLELAAVMGARFNRKLLTIAAADIVDLEAQIETLVERELIQPEPGGRVLSFRRSLARDAIYDSLLTPRRQDLHRQVAEAMEGDGELYPDDVADQLAHHWRHSATPERAIRYLAMAGDAALRVYALDEAERNFDAALELVGDPMSFPDHELVADIILSQSRVLYFMVNFAKVVDQASTYLPVFEALGDESRLSRYLFEVGYLQVFMTDVEPGRANLARSKALGESAGDELAVAYADLGYLWDRAFWGEPSEERTRLQRETTDRLVEIGRKHSDIWLASKALLAFGTDRSTWGYPDETRETGLRMIALSRETNDPRARSMGYFMLAVESIYSGDYENAVEQAEESLRISLSPIDRSIAQNVKGSAQIFLGQAKEIIEAAEIATRAMYEGGNIFNTTPVRMMVGVGQILAGNMSEGMQKLMQASREPAEWGQTIQRSTAKMLLGEVYYEMVLGKDKPGFSVMMRNLPFLLRTLPFAKSRARRYTSEAVEELRGYDSPSHTARALLTLAKLDIAGRKSKAAAEKLAEALTLAQSVGATGLQRDAEAQLQKIKAA